MIFAYTLLVKIYFILKAPIRVSGSKYLPKHLAIFQQNTARFGRIFDPTVVIIWEVFGVPYNRLTTF